ncbi:hypothetical protein AB0283_21450 [Micromonospora vinacea]|uniref:hypothetical protein n=1 Tax=Micromonospora vinacea TaxID=709878 RepID=UPI00344B3341
MSYADLTVAQWNNLTDGAARRVTEEIADRHGLTEPVGLQDTVYAGRSHRVALFERDRMWFALVPGDRPTLMVLHHLAHAHHHRTGQNVAIGLTGLPDVPAKRTGATAN